jgi:hypothetical protein
MKYEKFMFCRTFKLKHQNKTENYTFLKKISFLNIFLYN